MYEDSHIRTYAQVYRRRAAYAGIVGVLIAVGYVVVATLPRGGAKDAGITVVTEPIDTRGTASVASALVDDELPTTLALPPLSVTAALVTKLGDQKPLFAYRPDSRWPLASVTKLMTALVAFDALTPGAIVEMSAGAVATEGVAGEFAARERYSVADLARAMLVVSSNDAAMAVAEAYDRKQLGAEAFAGALNTTALFTELMQQRARDLGMYATYFGDPSGLSVINQSTLGDVALLIEYLAQAHPEILEMTTKRTQSILERRSMTRRTLTNINQFAGRADFIGGKTGYTDEAGGNLVSLFEHAGNRYLIIVLGTTDRFGETEKLLQWLKQTSE